MDDKYRKKLEEAGIKTDELDKTVGDAIRSAKSLPVLKAETNSALKISWLVRYPQGYEDREEQEIVELGKADPLIMIASVDNYKQIVDKNDITNKIYFEVNGRVVIDKRSQTERELNETGSPSKGCTIVFLNEKKELTVGMFYISVTNLRALDMFAKKVKAEVGNFSKTLIKLTTDTKTKSSYAPWVVYDYELAGDPDEAWVDGFITAYDEVRERENIYANLDSTVAQQTEASAPGMGDEL